jgi:DNA-binding NtrC family response regulator
MQHHWQGNVRELRNVVERLLILADNPVTAQDVKNFA